MDDDLFRRFQALSLPSSSSSSSSTSSSSLSTTSSQANDDDLMKRLLALSSSSAESSNLKISFPGQERDEVECLIQQVCDEIVLEQGEIPSPLSSSSSSSSSSLSSDPSFVNETCFFDELGKDLFVEGTSAMRYDKITKREVKDLLSKSHHLEKEKKKGKQQQQDPTPSHDDGIAAHQLIQQIQLEIEMEQKKEKKKKKEKEEEKDDEHYTFKRK